MARYVTGAAEAFAARAERLGVPANVTFQITDRCNFRCAHCYETHGEADELSTEEVIRILEDVAASGVLFLTLTGGEVFMRRDLDEILAATRRLRFAVRLYTTGHFIDEARAARLSELAIQEVHLSLYGPDAASHEAVSKMPHSFDRTVGAARMLRRHGVQVVLKAPMMSTNIGRHEELVELIEGLGCRYAFDPKVTSREDGERSPLHLRPSDDDLLDFYAHSKINDEGAVAQAERVQRFDIAVENRGGSCRIGQVSCSINPQGLVFGCVSLPVPVGDLRRERFLDVWRGSTKLKQLREIRWDDIVVCRECALRPFCNRCHAMALLEDGNMLGPSTEACRHAVAQREALRERGMLPAGTSMALPVPLGGAAPTVRHVAEKLAYGYRPAGLRILQ